MGKAARSFCSINTGAAQVVDSHRLDSGITTPKATSPRLTMHIAKDAMQHTCGTAEHSDYKKKSREYIGEYVSEERHVVNAGMLLNTGLSDFPFLQSSNTLISLFFFV